ncbi:MAG: hypothetical protein HKN23_11835 [Verrucomicrobiales bacterium]|nr:hypothetical protein [Verrucomicrobiales bacterium]
MLEPTPDDPSGSQPPPDDGGKKKKKKSKLGTSRGIETLFRNTYRVHVEVSALADTKANFLISVNSIVMILLVSHGMNYIVGKPWMLVPVGIVIATSIGSMIFSVLVARPRIKKVLNPHDPTPQTRGGNLLFFGSFTELTEDEFVANLSETVKDPEVLYPMMMADIYSMGLVLRKKFARLQIAYGFLLYGMPVGVVIFVGMQAFRIVQGMDL